MLNIINGNKLLGTYEDISMNHIPSLGLFNIHCCAGEREKKKILSTEWKVGEFSDTRCRTYKCIRLKKKMKKSDGPRVTDKLIPTFC